MSRRFLPVAVVALAAAGAAPAGAQTPTDRPVPGVAPGACADLAAPASSFTRKAARRARRTRVIRGVAADVGCGLNRVEISVNRKRGKRCRPLTARKHLARRTTCKTRVWLPVAGGAAWRFRLPKRLPAGRYIVRTRAHDFAGNVERGHGRSVRLAKKKARR